MSQIKLSVVIPAYNESKNLSLGALQTVFDYLKKQRYSWEVLVVDDGSVDDTAKKIERDIKRMPGFKLIKNPHGGKAIAVMTGMIKSSGDLAVFTDFDQATPIDQIEKFFPKFDEGFDIVIGSRRGREGAPLIRKISAWGFSFLRNLILGLPFKDTQCGFKAFNKKSIETVFVPLLRKWERQKAKGAAVNAGWDAEFLYKAKKKSLKIIEVPVDWHYVGTERVQLVKDAVEAIKDMLRIRVEDLQGKYD